MGNVKWTTPAEDQFLETNVSQYEAAQAGKQVAQWLQSFDLRWLLKFPEYSDGRKPVPLEVLKKRIRSWFNNHTGVRAKKPKPVVAKIRTNGKAPRDPFATALLGGGADRPKQRLQPKQAYGVMMRDTTLKSDIDDEWKLKLLAEPELAEVRGAFLKYFAMRVGQRYDAESDEVKAQVEQFREEEYQRNLASNSPQPLLLEHEKELPADEKAHLVGIRTMQRAYENMDYACACFANTVARLSKASVIISVVGPEPKRHGHLAVSQVSFGSRLSDGKDIFQAHQGMVSQLTNEQKVFARACFNPEDVQAFRDVYPLVSGRIPVLANAPADVRDDLPRALPDLPPNAEDENDHDDEPDLNLAKDDDLDDISLQYGFGKNKRAFGKFKQHAPSPSQDSDEECGFDNENSDEEEGSDIDNTISTGNPTRPVVPDPTCPSSPSLRIVERRGGSDDFGRVKLAGGAWLSNYEYNRLVKIAENKQLIATIDIPGAVQTVIGPRPTEQRERARVPTTNPTVPPRVLPPRVSKSQNISYRIPGLNELEVDHADRSNGSAILEPMPSIPGNEVDLLTSTQHAVDSSTNVADGARAPPLALPETMQRAALTIDTQYSRPNDEDVVGSDAQKNTASALVPSGVAQGSSGPVPALARSLTDVGAVDDGQDVRLSSTLNSVGQILSSVPHPSGMVLGADTILPANSADEPVGSPRERAKAAKQVARPVASPAGRVTAVEVDKEARSHVPSSTNSEFPCESARAAVENVDHPTAVQNIDKVLFDITASTSQQQNNQRKIEVGDVDPLTIPAWIEQHFIYLRRELQGRAEGALLLDWLTLECEDELKAKSPKLPATRRPHAVSAWLHSKSSPGDEPPKFDPKGLMDQWREWWISLMPEWRLAGKRIEDDDVWPMSRRTPAGETWKKVRKAGPQGMFLVLLGLAFWHSACGVVQSSRREYDSALEDASWVLTEIVKDMVPFPQRNRPARSVSQAPAASTSNSVAEEAEGQSRRTSTRVSRPTKRKLSESEIKEHAPRVASTKRRAAKA